MLPGHALSTTPQPAPFRAPYERQLIPLVDYELGGVALNDPSAGLQVKVWTCERIGDDIVVSASDVSQTTLFTREGITELSLSFDQNMRPAVAFMQSGTLTLWWFDTFVGHQVFTTFEGEQPKIRLDDKRHTQNGSSDLILAYLRDGVLYFREQRDRFSVERQLADVSGYLFKQMGMNTVNRLQFQFEQIVEDSP